MFSIKLTISVISKNIPANKEIAIILPNGFKIIKIPSNKDRIASIKSKYQVLEICFKFIAN